MLSEVLNNYKNLLLQVETIIKTDSSPYNIAIYTKLLACYCELKTIECDQKRII